MLPPYTRKKNFPFPLIELAPPKHKRVPTTTLFLQKNLHFRQKKRSRAHTKNIFFKVPITTWLCKQGGKNRENVHFLSLPLSFSAGEEVKYLGGRRKRQLAPPWEEEEEKRQDIVCPPPLEQQHKRGRSKGLHCRNPLLLLFSAHSHR